MEKWNLTLGNGFLRTGKIALCGLFIGTILAAPTSAPARRINRTFALGPACQAALDPRTFSGKLIVDRILIGDVSPHGYLYQSRHCKFDLGVFWAKSLSSADFQEHLSSMFYRPSRLPAEIGPRLIEATIQGRVTRHRFPEGDKPVWALKIEHISDLAVAPEGYCAVNLQDWFDLQKSICNPAKTTAK